MSDFYTFILKILKLWFGNPRTRLPKALILTSVALIASPWWQPLLIASAVKWLQLDPLPLQNTEFYVQIFGILMFAIGLVLYIRTTSSEAKETRLKDANKINLLQSKNERLELIIDELQNVASNRPFANKPTGFKPELHELMNVSIDNFNKQGEIFQSNSHYLPAKSVAILTRLYENTNLNIVTLSAASITKITDGLAETLKDMTSGATQFQTELLSAFKSEHSDNVKRIENILS